MTTNLTQRFRVTQSGRVVALIFITANPHAYTASILPVERSQAGEAVLEKLLHQAFPITTEPKVMIETLLKRAGLADQPLDVTEHPSVPTQE